LERGAVVGAVALVQGKGCEAAIASTEMTGFVLPAQDFLDWVEQDTELKQAFLTQQPDSELIQRNSPAESQNFVPRSISGKTREQIELNPFDIKTRELSEAETHVPTEATNPRSISSYPHISAQETLPNALACFQMICRSLQVPFRRDTVQRVLGEQIARTGGLSLGFCGSVAELLGLQPQLVHLETRQIQRLPVPAIVPWQEGFAVIYETGSQVVLGVPELGIVTRTIADLMDLWGPSTQALLLQATPETPRERFGLSWFWPVLMRYRRVLFAVLVASFFVQLLELANPLMLQVIIDKVIGQNSPQTLDILGIFLLVIAVFDAVLASFRTYLFVDTTNRIDLRLGSEIIDHLLRLPLRYFDRRPVGELASRVNELENIRQFLTGTALTGVLDAVFSILYIVILFIYSWLLSLVALSTIPLFVGLTALVSPIVRRQLRTKADRNARTQSYLVEVLSGIQTVKAQNLELRSRWRWQEFYARYVSAGFKTVFTNTTAAATSHFLNKLSALLVIWVGAHLVLKGDLTLGQLIAFRIIAGYVTSPLLRLTQLWQNFQETALSLERLSDILDHPRETEGDDRQIPLPAIQGTVQFEQVSFRFAPNGPLQLENLTVTIPAGTFVGIVGESGSGKSTLVKLLARLYSPTSGRILVDDYEIGKVQLDSLRHQIGLVPQDSLLFEGTVQENIALTRPDAPIEEVIEAAQIACAHTFIMGLPEGYNTRVGERGASLSGGQRQRIAIARMVLQNPQMVVLDEATSALDYPTERELCLNLMRRFRDRTVFFITHRLSTVQGADRILVLHQGLLSEQGTHAELMAIQGRYYCLYQQQELTHA
ncbi:MAG: peptidase domain-containing ABC transporter, partial [Leptolyngbyaceae cyanobacterium bins.59]|nr:peptidase domain-containing ABC transporter [Leptolyngbyaceae cyanobacterium bins.59]